VKTAAIVGWSGNGSLPDLDRSVSSKLGLGRGLVSRGSRSLSVEGEDPVAVARKLAHMPGTEWVAVGYEFIDQAGCDSALKVLAERYLQPGSSFRLAATVEESGREEGDILLDGNGTILKAVKKSRVDEKRPDVTFRIVMVRDKGAVGVQLREGPGGVPTDRRAKAWCLVSGGYHSAVAAWMAALSGYSVTLVHARTDDESLRQVARLYAELSHRADAKSIALEVLDGEGSAGERLAAWLGSAKGDVFAGVHPVCRGRASREVLRAYPMVLLPLLFVPEEEILGELQSLGIKTKQKDGTATLEISGKAVPFVLRRYGGKESDINGVLDGILH
jgi:adenylyl- and sulfurtransferase ThiI